MPPDTVNDQIKLWWFFLLCKLSELDLELFSSLLKKEILLVAWYRHCNKKWKINLVLWAQISCSGFLRQSILCVIGGILYSNHILLRPN